MDTNFFQKYLGMRNESVDEVEILRRMDLGIYDPDEFAKAMAWVKKYCMPNEGWDKNPKEKQKTRGQKDKDWEFVVKMTIIVMDLMHGNPKLREMGFKEEALGHNAIAGGFQDSASGPTGCLTGTSPRLFSTPTSTGTDAGSLRFSPPRTTRSTGLRCCWPIC